VPTLSLIRLTLHVCAIVAGFAAVSEAFQGRVVDGRTGDPIAGAEVSVLGYPGVVITDADGRFTWTPNPAPPFEILVVLPGGQVTRPIFVERIDAAAVMTFEVQPTVTEEVTVAAGAAPSIDAAPGAGMTLLTGREVALRQPANLMQALENVPGVGQVSEGQAAVPAVRGLARGRTLLLIDGARVTAERRVGPSATFLDPVSAESFDIARGPGSVAYGSDAFGGVISVQTRRPDPTVPLLVRFSGTAGAGIPEARGAFEVARGHGTGGVLLQVHARKAGDHDSPAGRVLNSGWRDGGFLVRLDQRAGGGLFSAGWQSDMGRDIERPRSNSSATRFYYPYENSHRFTASWEAPSLGRFDEVKVSGFLGRYSQRTDQDRVPTASVTRRIERSDVDAKDFQLRATAEKAIGGADVEIGADVNGRFGLEAHDLTIGYDQAGHLTSTVDSPSVASAHRTDTGLFVQARRAAGTRMLLAGGLRGDVVTNTNIGGYFGDRSVTNGAASGFVSATVSTSPGLAITAQLSRGFLDPRLSDRYYRGPTGRGYITGQPDLKPETSLQFDLAARYTARQYRLAAYLYEYRIANLVERYEATADFFYFRNRGRARIRGVELELQARLPRDWSIELGGQISRGVAPEDGDAPLDDQSPDSLSASIRKALGERGQAFVRVAAFAKDDRPGPSEIATPGHVNVDIGGSWRLSGEVELRGLVRNLLNQSYYSSPDRRWVPAPGINGAVTVVVTFTPPRN
jgi:iron complex outermembrane recepter protein